MITEHTYGTHLRNNDRVTGLKFNVLRHILALADILVIKRDSGILTDALSENIDGFLLCEVAETTGQRDRVDHRGRCLLYTSRCV